LAVFIIAKQYFTAISLNIIMHNSDLIQRHFRTEQRFSRFMWDYSDYLREQSNTPDDLAHFFAFVTQHCNSSSAQLFQDLWALWETGGKTNGFFVEFGAADGKRHSNTYLLEREHGWNGILAEPNPIFWSALEENRRAQLIKKCVFSHTGANVTFLQTPSSQLSRLKDVVPDDAHEAAGRRTLSQVQEIQVDTISLNDMLESAGAPTDIDFMSIDTEGSELCILEAFDFNKWRVKAMCIEHNKSSTREPIYQLLRRNSYARRWVNCTRFDDWYVLAD